MNRSDFDNLNLLSEGILTRADVTASDPVPGPPLPGEEEERGNNFFISAQEAYSLLSEWVDEMVTDSLAYIEHKSRGSKHRYIVNLRRAFEDGEFHIYEQIAEVLTKTDGKGQDAIDAIKEIFREYGEYIPTDSFAGLEEWLETQADSDQPGMIIVTARKGDNTYSSGVPVSSILPSLEGR